jgi:type IV pilus assembly protein PilV
VIIPRSPAVSPKQTGFALIEALIAVLVLSIGLIGLAALQTVSLKMSHGAYLRSQATMLASEIADSMRVNRGAAASYAGTYAAVTCNSSNVRATSGTIASADLGEWRNRLACLLPGGNAIIATSGTRATITVIWDETRYGGDSATSFAFSTDL